MEAATQMTINGIFFDLYGTLLVYGNMDAAWSDWLKALHAQLKLRGLTCSIESLAKTCDQFYSKSEPTPRQHNLTVFEQRIQNLCFDLKLNLTVEEIKVTANRVANAWQKHISLDPEVHSVLPHSIAPKNLPSCLISTIHHTSIQFSAHLVLHPILIRLLFPLKWVSRNPIHGYSTRLLNRLD